MKQKNVNKISASSSSGLWELRVSKFSHVDGF